MAFKTKPSADAIYKQKHVKICLKILNLGDADISMVVGTSLVDIPLGIKNISFSGILRIEFRDLVPEAPIVSAVVAYFVKRPLLEFNLTKVN